MTDDWLSLQQKYWEQWTDLSRKAMGAQAPQMNPWEGALDHWWKAFAPAAPDMSRTFMERMMDQGKMFFRMADTFARPMPQFGGSPTDAWSHMTKALNDMQKAFSGGQEQGDQALHKMMAFWELPYDNWQRMASSMSPMPGDLLRNMPHAAGSTVDKVLSAPGLGYTREEQSQYQDLMRRSVAYQKALQEYMSIFSQMGVKSVNRMREVLEQMQASGKSIDTARGLYDTWVGCCEDVYAQEVKSPDYARIHGDLVNAQMALKQRMSIMVDETLGGMNMPTRGELRTLQDRVQQSRRENKMLRKELHALQLQVAALTGAGTGAPAAVPAVADAAAPERRPVIRKKPVPSTPAEQ
ncbi:MAG: class III poly(R)-hydroxyalkanoic acid synthase subunit PhaE [Chromatiaceae bacterium]|nr:class III poly(R)-hydroxyalkanoic acid synthase subunit PhaE [Chromatiaceae bacterium]